MSKRSALKAMMLLCVLCAAAVVWAATTFTTLVSFDQTNGAFPQYGYLVQGFNGNLYGTTREGGANTCPSGNGPVGCGTVFEITPAGTLTTLYSFCSQTNCTDGRAPWAGLVQAPNGSFYGTTQSDGADGYGTVFEMTPAGTLTTLHSFDATDGAYPLAGLVQAANGNFYGTTSQGGPHEYSLGTVFEITAGGTLATLHSFCSSLTNCTDGEIPYGGLVQATSGSFYGTTYEGGASSACLDGCGTVFEITASGTLTTLHSFDSTDGAYPLAGLVQAANGNFYGTTSQGGPHEYSLGTVFEITTGGTLATLHSFCSSLTNCTDGEIPYGGLVQATNGNFYGTTYEGGASSACLDGCGTVFEITASGTLTTLHSFDSTDGANPVAGLVQATNGNFYGTTYGGGASSACSSGCGTVFEITASGTLTTLHSFDSTDGANPVGGLVQATDGNFYGTTEKGGADGHGTVFEITPAGTLTTLYSFCSQTGCDGIGPAAGLLQATNGSFYGTTVEEGTSNTCSTDVGKTVGCGTVFTLSVGLGPFVETLPTSGKVGAAVIILGSNLTGTTSVTFNGTAATFTVASSTEIKATVPNGATTGKVQVTTPSGTLTGNVVFNVL
jgi:uncharacterized repeat protein (TIGR03803 family)